ncbi:MAG: hypothetical protein FWD42_04430 [Solirubrobacterales bacterium]|nr:hypothetical protein [Solirubrobacterales bacterium]
MSARRAKLVAACALALGGAPLALSPPASASFAAAGVISGTAAQQFEEARAPALAAAGGYVAFQGSLAGVSGVWRRNLGDGAIEAVATAHDANDPQLGAPDAALAAPDAAAPSISAEGRYVAFTTTADLDPEHAAADGAPEGEPAADTGCPEVYVRDMERQPGQEGAYLLASALDGSGRGIAFSSCSEGGGAFAIAGAQAAPAVAISADGSEVAFTVLSESNLFSYPGAPGRPTPPSQVAVRNLRTDTTTVVSVTPGGEGSPAGEPAPGGGAFPSQASEGVGSLRIVSGQLGDELTASTAAISGDGGTVAWLGTDVPEQVSGSGPEIETGIGGAESGALEAEPLWRHIAGGSAAFTRRLLVDAGLDFFYNRGELGEVVRGGSFVATGDAPLFLPPALSEDGDTVAVVADAPSPAALRGVELGGVFPPQSDAYAVRVSDAASVAPQVVPLTETRDYDMPSGAPTGGFVKDVAVSPDGERVAFDSGREAMTLPALVQVSPPAGGSQAYLANLARGTLERASVAWNGEPAGGEMELLSLDGAHALVFASSATNLFYGDAIQAPEVYLAEELPAEEPPASEQLQATPLEALPQPRWVLDATATTQGDGSVLVRVHTPGAGRLAVHARAQLPARRRSPAGAPAGGRRARRSRSPRRSTHSAPRRAARRVAARHSARAAARRRERGRAGAGTLTTRTVAGGVAAAQAAATMQLRLRAASSDRSYVDGAHGLYAILHITFAAPGQRTLSVEVPATFHRTGKRRRGRAPRRAGVAP